MENSLIRGMRVLDADEIRNLSDSGLRMYRKAVLKRQAIAHEKPVQYCCYPKSPDCTVIRVMTATPIERERIRKLDWLAARCAEEHERRKLRHVAEVRERGPKVMKRKRRS